MTAVGKVLDVNVAHQQTCPSTNASRFRTFILTVQHYECVYEIHFGPGIVEDERPAERKRMKCRYCISHDHRRCGNPIHQMNFRTYVCDFHATCLPLQLNVPWLLRETADTFMDNEGYYERLVGTYGSPTTIRDEVRKAFEEIMSAKKNKLLDDSVDLVIAENALWNRSTITIRDVEDAARGS